MFDMSEQGAIELDRRDELRSYRERFEFPTRLHANPVYLTGNSLGLMPKATRTMLEEELDDWAGLGVEGHFEARRPWMPYHELLREPLARLVGALPHEVVAMNSLTVNLHLMMVSFYRPTAERFKIVVEEAAFPSDTYAVLTHAASRGLDPEQAVVRLKPREGENSLRDEDVVEYLEREGKSVALVMLGGVNYRNGQLMDMAAITRAGHKAGAMVGWDLAHAVGNVPLELHGLGADFACWCSYKYLNSGPGAVAGCFVHERHAKNTKWKPDTHAPGSESRATKDEYLPRLSGWWGNDPATRFVMGPAYEPSASADAWQCSNPPIMAMAPVLGSLKIFDEVGMDRLRAKSLRLTAYMHELLKTLPDGAIEVLTPGEERRRGCQWSIAVRGGGHGKELLKTLRSHGVICDFREPNVIRAAPVPLYNSFHDVWRFVDVLRAVVR